VGKRGREWRGKNAGCQEAAIPTRLHPRHSAKPSSCYCLLPRLLVTTWLVLFCRARSDVPTLVVQGSPPPTPFSEGTSPFELGVAALPFGAPCPPPPYSAASDLTTLSHTPADSPHPTTGASSSAATPANTTVSLATHGLLALPRGAFHLRRFVGAVGAASVRAPADDDTGTSGPTSSPAAPSTTASSGSTTATSGAKRVGRHRRGHSTPALLDGAPTGAGRTQRPQNSNDGADVGGGGAGGDDEDDDDASVDTCLFDASAGGAACGSSESSLGRVGPAPASSVGQTLKPPPLDVTRRAPPPPASLRASASLPALTLAPTAAGPGTLVPAPRLGAPADRAPVSALTRATAPMPAFSSLPPAAPLSGATASGGCSGTGPRIPSPSVPTSAATPAPARTAPTPREVSSPPPPPPSAPASLTGGDLPPPASSPAPSMLSLSLSVSTLASPAGGAGAGGRLLGPEGSDDDDDAPVSLDACAVEFPGGAGGPAPGDGPPLRVQALRRLLADAPPLAVPPGSPPCAPFSGDDEGAANGGRRNGGGGDGDEVNSVYLPSARMPPLRAHRGSDTLCDDARDDALVATGHHRSRRGHSQPPPHGAHVTPATSGTPDAPPPPCSPALSEASSLDSAAAGPPPCTPASGRALVGLLQHLLESAGGTRDPLRVIAHQVGGSKLTPGCLNLCGTGMNGR